MIISAQPSSRRSVARAGPGGLGVARTTCATSSASPDRFERAALRWLARFYVERREATLAQVQAAAWAFDNITDEPGALETLERLCSR
jgi:hypothetical protein